MKRGELTDKQWERLAPLLPPQRPAVGRPNKDHRLVVESICWALRTGTPWRDVPREQAAAYPRRTYRAPHAAWLMPWRGQGLQLRHAMACSPSFPPVATSGVSAVSATRRTANAAVSRTLLSPPPHLLGGTRGACRTTPHTA
ncbi:transposase [Corallococcus exiguus]|uniref:transposase n=1 Tax=Corallococcus exiguus TaxID=83462 RepID=UPI001493F0D3|nr:transposase [Corallococcus exiguus]